MPVTEEWNRILRDCEGELAAVEGNLLSAAKGKEVRTLFVTSCRPGEGKTTTAASVAQALAVQARASTLLVDAHLTAPRVHTLLGLPGAPGLTDVLRSRTTLDAAIRPTDQKNLSVLPVGDAPSDLANDLDPQVLAAHLSDLRARFRYVVFDGGSVQSSSDACVLGKLFDGVLLVVECEKTKWELLELAKDKVSLAGGTILGVVLNRRRYYLPRVLYGRV